jgi:hypothetical protein
MIWGNSSMMTHSINVVLSFPDRSAGFGKGKKVRTLQRNRIAKKKEINAHRMHCELITPTI